MIADTEGSSVTNLSFRHAALTHRGGLPSNEDACEVVATHSGSVLIIADGAGGHAHGEVASAVVVDAIKARIAALGRFVPAAAVVEELLRAAQAGLRGEITEHPTHFDMRSTAVVVLATRNKVWVGHVGDSRAYLVRDGKATQLTRDDTLVQTLVDIGQIDRQAAKKHSKANVLLQSVGDPREIEYHVSDAIDVRVGDVLIACSDGVTDVVDDDELPALLADGKSSERAQRVIDRAIAKSSPDNVTAAVAVWHRSNRPPSVSVRRSSPRTAAQRRKARDTFPLIAALCVMAVALGAAAVAKYRRTHAPLRTAHAVAPPHAMRGPVAPPVEPVVRLAIAPDASTVRPTIAAAVAVAANDASVMPGPTAVVHADGGTATLLGAVADAGIADTARVYLVDLPDDAQVYVEQDLVTPSGAEHVVSVPTSRRVMIRIRRPGQHEQAESIRLEPGHSFRLRAIRHNVAAPRAPSPSPSAIEPAVPTDGVNGTVPAAEPSEPTAL